MPGVDRINIGPNESDRLAESPKAHLHLKLSRLSLVLRVRTFFAVSVFLKCLRGQPNLYKFPIRDT